MRRGRRTHSIKNEFEMACIYFARARLGSVIVMEQRYLQNQFHLPDSNDANSSPKGDWFNLEK